MQNVGRRSIVILEAHQPCRGEFLLEVENVSDVGAAPAVNRLVVVTHYDDVAVRAAKELDELKLRTVGVLVLVDENELEAIPIAGECCFVLAEDFDRKDEQIVEAHGVRGAERRLHLAVDLGGRPRDRSHCKRLVFSGWDQRVLRIGDE